MVILRKKSAELYENYFRYFLASNSFSEQVKSRVSGSAQPQLPIRDMLSMEIKLPAFPTQIRITSVLSAYDDLIENNEKRIKILEEMAQLLYTEWFVKFRFPRQKEGGQAGHEKVKMVDSKTEYGLIPEGWEVKKLSQTVLINPAERVESGNAILHVPMEALSNTSCIIDITKTKLRDSASGVKFRNGDTLFARITPCLENGKTGFVQFLRENEIACGSTEFVVLRSRLLTPEYVYFLSRDKDFRETAKFTMTGASGRQRVRAEFFEEYLVVQPLKGVLDKYSQLVSANFREIGKLVKQNIVLQKIRDLLIPQLVAGKRELKNYGKC
jgi:type I restriction enzyme S subunit